MPSFISLLLRQIKDHHSVFFFFTKLIVDLAENLPTLIIFGKGWICWKVLHVFGLGKAVKITEQKNLLEHFPLTLTCYGTIIEGGGGGEGEQYMVN